MKDSRFQAVIVMASSMFLIGCPNKPPKPRGTVAALVTPGYGVEQLAVPGQELEWIVMSSYPGEFWVSFTGSSPCKDKSPTLHGTISSPAKCKVGAQSLGSGYLPYSYDILREDPSKRKEPGRSVTSCKGCIYSVPNKGSSGTVKKVGVQGLKPTWEPVDASEIGIRCDRGALAADPINMTSATEVWWQPETIDLASWEVDLDPLQTNQKPLCQNGQMTFNGDSITCAFDVSASGTYPYHIKLTGSAQCSSSSGTITVGTTSSSQLVIP